MTFRAVFLGLIGAVLMGAGGQYACKYVPGAWGLVRGHLPVSVFGLMIFFVLAVNPLLGKLRASWRLRPEEVALITALILVACGITEAGMMRYYPRQLVHPIHMNRTHPGWQQDNVLAYTPPAMLANNGKDSEEVVDNFISAMGEPGKPIPIRAVPWHAWWKPLGVWTPLILLTMFAAICLAVIVHRQWADKERIRYPIAEIASSLLRQDASGRTTILQNKLFWLGLAIPLLIRVINGVQLWFPGPNALTVPMVFDFSALKAKFPEFMKTPGANHFLTPTIYPACIGLTYLLASDIGLSLGIGNLLSVTALYLMIVAGVDMTAGDMSGGYVSWQNFGSSLGLAVMLVYVGRRYYWHTLKEAVSFVPQPETERSGVWALRGFVLCIAGCVAILSACGMDWTLALIAMLAIMLVFLVCTRLNAECGTFFFGPGWGMPVVLVGLCGLTDLGPTQIIILGFMLRLMQGDTFECLMPFVANGLKMTSDTALKPGKTGALLAAGVLLTVAVAVPTALWADYNHAAALDRGGDGAEIFNAAQRSITQLKMSGELDKVMRFGTWDRLNNLHPDRTFLLAAGVGFGLLILCSVLRLRYTWWPLHPVIILAFGTRTVGQFGFSFLLGWFVKSVISKFGGAKRYEEVKNFMLGVIAGDLLGGFLTMAASWIYYGVTGLRGPNLVLW